MPMNVRLKYHLLLFVFWPVIGFLLFIPVAFLSPWFFVLIVLWSVVIEFITSRIRCPYCRSKVGWGRYIIFGFHFEWWKVWIPKHCEKCGFELSAVKSTHKKP